jgi:hypothetical protein
MEQTFDPRRGASLIDLIVGLAILSMLFGGIYMVYFSILDASTNVELRTTAASVLSQQVEIIRNLPYDKVGTVGGVPSGVIPQQQQVNVGDKSFLVKTTVRNVDDPFDGTLGGSPNDNAPADYKLVGFDISCLGCPRFVPLSFTTTVAPKNLETAGASGSLFVNVFDASGLAVPGATVRITNASITPSIDLTDITNAAGLLQLVGVPSSTQRYRIEVTKSGYSSDRTYPLGGAGNPNPVKPDATVAVQSVTNMSFAIDRTSQLTLRTSDQFCAPVPNRTFSIAGAKTIGPGVLKFSTTSQTDGSGAKTLNNLEWDTYNVTATGAGYDLAGTLPLLPMTLDPNVTADLRMVLLPSTDSLLVTARDAGTGQGVPDTVLTLAKSGVSRTLITGHASVGQTNWSGANRSDLSSGIDADSVPGRITLLANASGTYPDDTEWLISNTIDLGGQAATLYGFAWSGSAPPFTGPNSVQFQLAANNDGSTWNFIGPDGTGGTYYTAGSSTPHASLSGKRYVRYKVYLSTANQNATPEVDDISFDFRADCVPTAQSLFQNLPAGTYTLTANASGHPVATSSVVVGAGFQRVTISL